MSTLTIPIPPENTSKGTASNRRAQVWIFAFFLLFSLLSVFWFLKSPESSRGPSWFRDGGFVLNTAQKMLAGKQLYSDLFYQYGPVPIESYLVWAKLFGNSTSSLFSLSFALHLASLALLFKALQKARLSPSTLAITLFVISLSVLSGFNALDDALYPTYEQILILSAVILWEPIGRRSIRRGVALGLIVGGLQWVRFGAAVGVLVGIFSLDLLAGAASWRSYVKATTAYVAGFFSLEFCFAAWLFARYPSDIATDTLWPLFMSASYSVYTEHLPKFTSLNFFVGSEMILVVYSLLGIVGVAIALKRRAADFDIRLLLPLFAYLFYSIVYYKTVWHFYRGSWMLCIVGAPALNRLSWRYKTAVLLLLLPGFFVGFKQILPHHPSAAVACTVLPNGDTLWLAPSVIRGNDVMIEKLHLIKSDPGRDGILFASRSPAPVIASNFYYFYKLPQPARHSMIFPGWLRDLDFKSLPITIGRSKALVLFQGAKDGKPGTDACNWEGHPYPAPYCELITPHLQNPIRSDDTTWIYPLN